MSDDIKKPLGLIDHDNLQANETILAPVTYEMFPNDTMYLIKKMQWLVTSVRYLSPLDKKWHYTQQEYPLKALPWIIDRIENGFWKSAEEGGLSNFERSVSQEFDGEIIGINVMMHCCAENVPGYNIWNNNRASYIDGDSLQEWDIPNYMLKDSLLDELKKIAAQYCD